MYTRSYYADDTTKLTLPENYDGTAFMEREAEELIETPLTESASEPTTETSGKVNPGYQSYGKQSFLSGLFGDGVGFGGFRLPELGVEEILILATAAFLFFSKDGDRECALILLLLIFIN
jgi:hypothetical protein